jgi:hypothetical protein
VGTEDVAVARPGGEETGFPAHAAATVTPANAVQRVTEILLSMTILLSNTNPNLLDDHIMAHNLRPLAMGMVVNVFGSGWTGWLTFDLWAGVSLAARVRSADEQHPRKAALTKNLQPIPNHKPTDCVVGERHLCAILVVAK